MPFLESRLVLLRQAKLAVWILVTSFCNIVITGQVTFARELLLTMVRPGVPNPNINWAVVTNGLEEEAQANTPEGLQALELLVTLLLFGLPREGDGACAFPEGVPRDHERAAKLLMFGLERGGCGRCHLLLGFAHSVELPIASVITQSEFSSTFYHREAIVDVQSGGNATVASELSSPGEFAPLDRPIIAYDMASLTDVLGSLAAVHASVSGLRVSPTHLRLRDPRNLSETLLWEASAEPLLWRAPRPIDPIMAQQRCMQAIPKLGRVNNETVAAASAVLPGLQNAWLVQSFLPDTGLPNLPSTRSWANFVHADAEGSGQHLAEAALLHFHGHEEFGIQRNVTRAFELWVRAAKNGDVVSAFNLMSFASDSSCSREWAQLALDSKKLSPHHHARAEACVHFDNATLWTEAMRRATDLGDPDAALELAEVLSGNNGGEERRQQVVLAISETSANLARLILQWYKLASNHGRLRGLRGVITIYSAHPPLGNHCEALTHALRLGHSHPEVLLVMGHARRCSRLKDWEGAALRYALASEFGVTQAHIGAAAVWELRKAQGNMHEESVRARAIVYHDRALRAGHTWAAHRLRTLAEPSKAYAALSLASKFGDVWAEAEAAIFSVQHRGNLTFARDTLRALLFREGIPRVLRIWVFIWVLLLFFYENLVSIISTLFILVASVCKCVVFLRRD